MELAGSILVILIRPVSSASLGGSPSIREPKHDRHPSEGVPSGSLKELFRGDSFG